MALPGLLWRVQPAAWERDRVDSGPGERVSLCRTRRHDHEVNGSSPRSLTALPGPHSTRSRRFASRGRRGVKGAMGVVAAALPLAHPGDSVASTAEPDAGRSGARERAPSHPTSSSSRRCRNHQGATTVEANPGGRGLRPRPCRSESRPSESKLSSVLNIEATASGGREASWKAGVKVKPALPDVPRNNRRARRSTP